MGAWRRTVVVAALIWALPATADPFREDIHVDGATLVVRNLVGRMTIEASEASGFDVTVEVAGRDASRERMTITEGREGGAALVHVGFPLDEEHRFVYPDMARRSRVSFTYERDGEHPETMLGSILRKVRGKNVRVSGSGSGLEMWADVTVRVPKDGTLTVRHGVGDLFVSNTNGTIDLHSNYGSVSARGTAGRLDVDTGNGDVTLETCRGHVSVDTGNGDVDVDAFEGERLFVDTGNGHVAGEGVNAGELHIDTGNGRIRLFDVRATSAELDTGNGSVELELAEMGDGPFVLDSGNGSLTLRLPKGASADVSAETGRGRVHVDVADADMDMRDRDRREARFRVGSGGAQVRLDTGNGSVRIEG